MVKTSIAAVLLLLLSAPPRAQSLRPQTSADDERANTHYNTGWALLHAESWEDAAKEFQTAIDIKRDFKLAYYGLGRANMALKHFAGAIRAYEQCRDLYTAQAAANFTNRIEAEHLIRQDTILLDTMISQLRGLPQTASIARRIAELQQEKQRLALRTRGTDTMSLTSNVPAFVSLALGSAYFRSSRMVDAEREYKAAVEVDPRAGEAYSNLAVVYLETGRIGDAERALASARKSGFKVNPQLEQDIKNSKKGGSREDDA